ncbi:hypothetical protein Lal_00009778 [Lupinus albus]|nr:hypothetical protein Lal_00009778 [Lupinus albus]
MNDLNQSAVHADKSDSYEWRHDKFKMYTVRSAYNLLTNLGHDPYIQSNHSHLLWKSRAPLKVTSFAWRLFQDRIPTKTALLRRGVSISDKCIILCSFCNEHPEITSHLFLLAVYHTLNDPLKVNSFVWRLFQDRIPTKAALLRRVYPTLYDNLFTWVNISVVLPLDLIQHLKYHMRMVKDRKHWKFWSIIWFTTIWPIWLSRNDYIFNKVRSSLLHILDSANVK